MRKLLGGVLCCHLLFQAGCGSGPRDVTHETSVEPSNASILPLDRYPEDQRLVVEVKFPDPVDVFILPADTAASYLDLKPGDAERQALAYKRAVTTESLVVDLPANTPASIVLDCPGKPTKGTVRITKGS